MTDPEQTMQQAYFALLEDRPEWFRNHPRGGITILTDPSDIEAARVAAKVARTAAGMSTTDTRTGVLASDPYMTVVRDAVRFPDGSLGLYNRILETSPVAILPLLDGKPVLMRVFRHGLRDWSLEFPRGSTDPGESPEEAAKREVKEEIGADTFTLRPLGLFTPGGSSLAIKARLFLAEVGPLGASDVLEAIEDVQAYDVEEVEARIASGEMIDGFSLALFLRARLTGCL
ncbi:MAG: NUDIX hydrolase [Gammaproteobacteria bacterium]|nr:NUDIX hydrolase [Gammaproteobacteria bacterium]